MEVDRALRASEDALLRAPLAACARRAKAQALKAGDRWRECAAFCDATAAAIGTPISEGMDMASRAACVARALAALDSASVEEDSLPEVWVWALRRTRRPDEPATRRAVARTAP